MPPVDTDVLDEAELLSRLEGDRELLSEIVQEFLRDCPKLVARIRDAIAAADGDALARAAHSLKGSAANFAAKSVFQAALELERIGGERDLARAEGAYSILEEELRRLERALTTLVQVQDA